MSIRLQNQLLLAVTFVALVLGFISELLWAVGGIAGLLVSLMWIIRQFQRDSAGSDVLAILALLGTLFTQEYLAASIVALMLGTGRVLESWAEGQAERQLKALISRVPTFVKVVLKDGSISTVAIADVHVGDRILIRSGEITPTDGKLVSAATLDESTLTGEPLPVNRFSGDAICSGVLNAGAPFEYISTSNAESSTYAGIVKLVQKAHAHSSPTVRIASTWAWRFVPVALVMASLAWALTGEFERAVAVLVAATPCPLILAVPISVVAGLSRSAKSGVIIKGGAILEKLASAKVVLLDKTGTLTHGGPSISAINSATDFTEDEILTLAASIDQYSPHVVAKALVEAAENRNLHLLAVGNVTEDPGHHISGEINGDVYSVGQLQQSQPDWLTFSHALMVAVTKNSQVIGVIGLEDPIRDDSRALIQELRNSGVNRILLVTGDNEVTAKAVADSVGITEVFSQISAQGKLEITEDFCRKNIGTVIAVGDGINDAPALATAHVGIAMGARGATAASEAADVVIVEDSISKVAHAIWIAKKSKRKALQAAGVGMGLSFVAMLAGAFGFATASQGALIQEGIDLIAVLWALTALRIKI
jgi:heavy metal translocating P-type ATPase